MDKLYSIIEVATKLGLSDKTLRRWEEAGRFSPSRTLGNQRRYSVEDLQILDAIKHGTIDAQSDLLTISQASGICGVSPTTILRWENEGKIHPFITSGNTYYPRTKLIEKMEELKKSYIEPEHEIEPISPPQQVVSRPQPQNLTPKPITPLASPSSLATPISKNTWQIDQRIWNIVTTLILILTYHFLFNQQSVPVSPQTSPTQSGAVQGVQAPDPKLDILEQKLQEHLSAEMLKDAKPAPITTINLDNTSLIAGTATLPKGRDSVVLTSDTITATTTINATFTSDYSPGKKYWITTDPGSFTLHTDFPVGADVSFNYSYLATPASPAPSSTPSATTSAILR